MLLATVRVPWGHSTADSMTELERNKSKAEQEMLRRIPTAARWHGIPPIYNYYFDFYLRWVLARMPLPNRDSPKPPPLSTIDYDPREAPLREHFKRGSAALHEVEGFLEELFGEQLEATLDRQASASDYKYVADVLREETQELNPPPITVVRALSWLHEQVVRLSRPELAIPPSSLPVESIEAAKPDNIETSLELPSSQQANGRWDGLFLDNYTLTDLDNLLVFVGLLETAEPRVVADNTKPAQWVAVVAALKKTKRTRADKAALYRAFSETYGAAVGSLRTFQGQHNTTNEDAQICYARALSRIGN